MTLVCEHCQVTFEPKWANHRRRQRFCGLSCASRFNARKRPGRTKTTKGYIAVYAPEHPSASRQGYIMEHRLVMEEMLGRLLTPNEVVHHKNGTKDDNRRSNLEVMTLKRHNRLPKKPARMMPCPHCGELIAVRNPRHGARGVTFSSPASPQ